MVKEAYRRFFLNKVWLYLVMVALVSIFLYTYVSSLGVSGETMNGVYIYFICYIMILLFSVLLVSADDFDFATSFSAVLTTLNNVGPGISLVGPVENFSQFSGLSKAVFCVDMLVGRLEIFPYLLLLSPELWRRKF